SLTGQAVLEVTAGPVFHDGPGVLGSLRERLSWYPQDVWLYALATDWHRLAQELPDVGRAGLRGDEDGSAVIAARHVRTMLPLAPRAVARRPWAGPSAPRPRPPPRVPPPPARPPAPRSRTCAPARSPPRGRRRPGARRPGPGRPPVPRAASPWPTCCGPVTG